LFICREFLFQNYINAPFVQTVRAAEQCEVCNWVTTNDVGIGVVIRKLPPRAKRGWGSTDAKDLFLYNGKNGEGMAEGVSDE
jgi:hypothetical protein